MSESGRQVTLGEDVVVTDGALDLEDLADEIRSSPPRALLDLADRLDRLAVTHEVAHANRVVDEEHADAAGESPSDDTAEDDAQTASPGHERVRQFPSDRRLVVDTPSEATTSTIGQFAHLVETSSDGAASIYQVDPIDVWTAPHQHVDALLDDYDTVAGGVPESVASQIREMWERGNAFRLRTDPDGGHTVLESESADVFEDVAQEHLEYPDHYIERPDATTMRIKDGAEASVKETLYDVGYPPIDDRDLDRGADLDITLDDDLDLRPYQQEWVDRFLEAGAGVIDAPPGSGKTVAAIAALAELGQEVLILVPSRELAQPWRDELWAHTDLNSHAIGAEPKVGQYHGGEKHIRPVTITTYDMASQSRHGRKLFDREWGCVVFDEAHHVPAEVWRRTADIQSRHRLGLTATPVRNDGKSEEIFTLIGRPLTSTWEELYDEGWVHRPDVEVRFVPWASDDDRQTYREAEGTRKMIAASANTAKLTETKHLLDQHADDKILIYSGWTDQGEEYADALGLPFIHGETSHSDREDYYQELRDGDRSAVIVSRVADEGIDLPDVDVVIIASMLGGSKRQGTQRVGRVMRPLGGADAYLLATRGSREEQYAREQMDYLRERGTVVSETTVGTQ